MISKIEVQIEELIASYPDLKIVNEDTNNFILEGNVFINAKNRGIQLADDFDIELTVPKNFPKEIPLIREKSLKIPKDFEHVYSDGRLCLAVDTEMQIFINDIQSLLEWFQKYVVDYFYTVMYIDRYNTFPYGERKHGIDGVLEFYQDYFNEKDVLKICNLLQSVKQHNIKGHSLCPCRKWKKI